MTQVLPTDSISMPLDVLNGVLLAAESVTPHVGRSLGALALSGTQEELEAFMHDILHVSDRLKSIALQLSESVTTVIEQSQDVQEEEVAPLEDTVAPTNEDTHESEADNDEFDEQAPAAEPEEESYIEPTAELVEVLHVQTTEQQVEVITEPVDELVVVDAAVEQSTREDVERDIELHGLSPNEKRIYDLTIAHLSQFDERQNLKSIISAVFGVSRLSKVEEDRLIQILQQAVQKNILRSYGKTFGYKTEKEQSALVNVVPKDAEPIELDEWDTQILGFITTSQQNGEMHIGAIVREFYGVQTIPRLHFKATIARLNYLAAHGYLLHAEGSPWYGVVEQKQVQPVVKPKDMQLPSIKTAPLYSAPAVEESLLQEEITVTADEPTATEIEKVATDAKVTEPAEEMTEKLTLQNNIVLNERESRMFLLIKRAGVLQEWFKQSDVQFEEIGFPNYKLQAAAFASLTSKLVEAGILTDNGKQRGGRKYKLTHADAAQEAEERPADEIAEPTEITKEIVSEPVQVAPVSAPKKPRASVVHPHVSLPERPKSAERVARFASKLLTAIDQKIEEQPKRVIKNSEIENWIAESLDITKQQAKNILNAYFETGQLRSVSYKGSRLVVGEATQLTLPTATNANEGLANGSSEEKRISELRDMHGKQIVAFLGTLGDKFRSEFKTAISKALHDELNVEDVNAVCRVLQREGLVEAVEPKGRGTGRTRKGVTWRLTNKGRASLQNSSTLSNAAKKALGKSAPSL